MVQGCGGERATSGKYCFAGMLTCQVSWLARVRNCSDTGVSTHKRTHIPQSCGLDGRELLAVGSLDEALDLCSKSSGPYLSLFGSKW